MRLTITRSLARTLWVFGGGTGLLVSGEGVVLLLERIRDVLKEDEAKDDVLVFGRIHVVAELVRGLPGLRPKPGIGLDCSAALPFALGATGWRTVESAFA